MCVCVCLFVFFFSNFAFGFHGSHLKNNLKIIQLIFELARGRKFSVKMNKDHRVFVSRNC